MPLEGLRILIVEDEYLAALAIRRLVEGLGAEVVGPAGRLEPATALVHFEVIDGAILDVKLDQGDSFPIADALLAKGLPFIFATGYSRTTLPDRFSHIPSIAKPVNEELAKSTMREAFAGADS